MPTFKTRIESELRAIAKVRLLYPVDDYDVPLLELDMQALDCPPDWAAWGSLAIASGVTDVWHFYADDHRWAPVLDKPWRVADTHPKAIAELNFSTDLHTPLSYMLGLIYSKRWCSRYWQSLGIPIWVDANFSPEQAEYQLLGVPPGWTAYSTRACWDSPEVTQEQFEMCCTRAQTKKIMFAVIGGGKKFKSLCKKHQWLWIPDTHERIKAKYRQQ